MTKTIFCEYTWKIEHCLFFIESDRKSRSWFLHREITHPFFFPKIGIYLSNSTYTAVSQLVITDRSTMCHGNKKE